MLSLVAEGLSNKAIAARLYVTERTVEAHVTQIFLKTPRSSMWINRGGSGSRIAAPGELTL